MPPPLYVDALEAVWLALNAIGVVLTIGALLEARRDLRAARDDEGDRSEPRELTAGGDVRRESLRLIVHTALLSIVIPGLFVDREIILSPILAALFTVPVVLLLQSALDLRERSILTEMLIRMIRDERAQGALESSVQKNIELTQEAASQAKAAYHEANNVNKKIADLTKIVGGKEDK